MKAKILTYLCIIAIIGVVIRLAYVAYQRRPVEAYSLQSEVVVDNSSYHAGDEIFWSMTICKLHNEEFYSQRSLENIDTGKLYLIPEILTKGVLKKGECSARHPSAKIPRDLNLTDGRYRICSQIIVPDSKKSIKPFRYCTNEFIIN